MTIRAVYKTFGEAYKDSLRCLLSEGRTVKGIRDVRSPGSHFGESVRDTIEIIGHSFEVTDPYASYVVSRARPLRLAYCLGSLVWTLNGSDNLEEIAFYNPRGCAFSDDGVHLSGAFGKRLFRYNEHLNQIDLILAKLKGDESSRRTTAMILVPTDQASGSREYPCAIGVQYLLRDGRLNAITFMRSQSAALVLPYDSFLFMSLQCALSQRLGVEPGTYVHVSGSFHFYADEFDTVRRVVEQDVTTLGLRDFLGPLLSFDRIRDFEPKVRLACERGDVGALNALAKEATLGLPAVEPANLVLLIHAFQRLSLGEQCKELAVHLSDPLRSLVLDNLLRGD
jgi:thymidylate synthase